MAAPGARGPPGGARPTIDIESHVDKRVRVRLTGGRELIGTLKGYDPLVNLVLDDTVELLRDAADPLKQSGATRVLGLVIARGTQVTVIVPEDGTAEIANPFAEEAEAMAE